MKEIEKLKTERESREKEIEEKIKVMHRDKMKEIEKLKGKITDLESFLEIVFRNNYLQKLLLLRGLLPQFDCMMNL